MLWILSGLFQCVSENALQQMDNTEHLLNTGSLFGVGVGGCHEGADCRFQETLGGMGGELSTFNQTSKYVLLGGGLLVRFWKKNWMKWKEEMGCRGSFSGRHGIGKRPAAEVEKVSFEDTWL